MYIGASNTGKLIIKQKSEGSLSLSDEIVDVEQIKANQLNCRVVVRDVNKGFRITTPKEAYDFELDITDIGIVKNKKYIKYYLVNKSKYIELPDSEEELLFSMRFAAIKKSKDKSRKRIRKKPKVRECKIPADIVERFGGF